MAKRTMERSGIRDAAALACTVAAASVCCHRTTEGGSLLFASPSGLGSTSRPRLRAAAAATDAGEASTAKAASGGANLLGAAMVGTCAAAASLARRSLRARGRRATAVCAKGEVIETQQGPVMEGVDYMITVPEGGVKDEDKIEVPRFIYEGSKEVKLDGREKVPSGGSEDPENMYFWKMAKDKRTIDVVFPIDEDVDSQDIIYRLGEDAMDARRGPTLELGYRYRGENGRFKEHLVLDGQILNSINREDSYWTIDEMAGVRVCVLTLTRPSMLRQRHDPILKRSTEEERIEPQTWDALLVEERLTPEITQKAYFDLSLENFDGEKKTGRLEFGLYGEYVPKTVKNFLGLVTGEYTDEDGNVCESAHCYKGTRFQTVMRDLLISCGNPGLDHVLIEMSQEELVEYSKYFSDFKAEPRKAGKVEPQWSIRWGADLGLPVDEDGIRKKEGSPIDGNSENELNIVVEILKEKVEEGNGASFIFFRPEWEKGCDVTGGTFPAEKLTLPHCKRGILSMDRSEDNDTQGSNFFITLREISEMDSRWCVFGEITDGWDVLNDIEDEFDSRADKITIEDCGILE